MFELIGWISGLCLAICGVPLAWEAVLKGRTLGINKPFLWLWYIGEVMGIIYCISLGSYPLIFNYGFNILLISPVLYYTYFPRKRGTHESNS